MFRSMTAQQMVTISTASANVLTAPFVVLGRLGLARGHGGDRWAAAWGLPAHLPWSAVATGFHSLTPIYALGPYAVSSNGRRGDPSDRLRPRGRPGATPYAELHARLKAGDLRYDFMVQFYRDPVKTPIDGALSWSERDAPLSGWAS